MSLCDCRVQRLNENKKRVTKLETEAEFRFKKLSDALEMKTNEMKQLSGEFEERMRRKEEEQVKLKKELTQIAIGPLNDDNLNKLCSFSF